MSKIKSIYSEKIPLLVLLIDTSIDDVKKNVKIEKLISLNQVDSTLILFLLNFKKILLLTIFILQMQLLLMVIL